MAERGWGTGDRRAESRRDRERGEESGGEGRGTDQPCPHPQH